MHADRDVHDVDDVIALLFRYVVSGSIQPGKLGYYKFTGNVPLLMKDVLEGTGPSVFFTTLTNLIGFAVASICPIVVVELLAKVMAICVVVNFSFLFLIFLPVVYLDACRSLKRGFRECSCFSIFCSEPTENEVFTADKIGTKSKGKAEEGGAAAGNALKEEVSINWAFFITKTHTTPPAFT